MWRGVAMKYAKKDSKVAVRFALKDETVQTLEGSVKCNARDAILTGAQGEQWPIERHKFDQTYEPVTPTLAGCDGTYRKRFRPVDAQRALKETEIALGGSRGTLTASPGDWLITDEDGARWVVKSGIFEQTYEPVDEGHAQSTAKNNELSGVKPEGAIAAIPVYVSVSASETANDGAQNLLKSIKRLLPNTPIVIVDKTARANEDDLQVWFELGAARTGIDSDSRSDKRETVTAIAERDYALFAKTLEAETRQHGVKDYTLRCHRSLVAGMFHSNTRTNENEQALQVLAGQLVAVESFNDGLLEHPPSSRDQRNYIEAYAPWPHAHENGLIRIGAYADREASAFQRKWQRLVFATTEDIARTSVATQSEAGHENTGNPGPVGRQRRFLRLFLPPTSLIALGLIAALGLASYSELAGGCNAVSDPFLDRWIQCSSPSWKRWFGIASVAIYLLALGSAWVRYATAKIGHWERKHQDYRLLAEGLRVQQVFNVLGDVEDPRSGQSRSIARDFPDGLPTESGWVRLAIASLLHAHHQVSERHDSMDERSAWVRKHFVEHQITYHRDKLIARRERAIHRLSVASRWGGGLFLLMMSLLVANEVYSIIVDGKSNEGFLTEMWRHFVLILQVAGLAFWGGMRKIMDSFALEQEAQRGERVLKVLQTASAASGNELIQAAELFLTDQVAWHTLHRGKPIEATTGG